MNRTWKIIIVIAVVLLVDTILAVTFNAPSILGLLALGSQGVIYFLGIILGTIAAYLLIFKVIMKGGKALLTRIPFIGPRLKRRLERPTMRKRYKGIRNIFLWNMLAGSSKKLFTKIPGLRTHFFKLRNFPGREPEIVFRNRLLFMRLLDQNLRFDIFYHKYMYMKEFAEILKQKTAQTNTFVNQDQLKKLILLYRSNRGKINLGAGSVGEDPITITGLEAYKDFKGWNYMNKVIIFYMNDLIKFFEQRYKEAEAARAAGTIKDFNERIKSEATNRLNIDLAQIRGPLTFSKKQYEDRIKNYIPHHTIKAYTLNLWDMFLSSKVSSYRFAKRGAKYTLNGSEGTVNENDVEVNVHGEFMEDVNAGIWPRRRLKNPKRDSMPFPEGESMGEIAKYYERDWDGFIWDFRVGNYHPYSRNVLEYTDPDNGAWVKGIWKDDKIPWLPRGGSKAAPAFDLRVLANPGIYTWYGRMHFRADEGTALDLAKMKNNEPHISQYGVVDFIPRLIERTSAQVEDDLRFLALYPGDTKKWVQTKEKMEAGELPVDRFIRSVGKNP